MPCAGLGLPGVGWGAATARLRAFPPGNPAGPGQPAAPPAFADTYPSPPRLVALLTLFTVGRRTADAFGLETHLYACCGLT